MMKIATLLALLVAGPAIAQTLPAKLPFSPSVRVGNTLYMSGQIGQVPAGMDPHKEGFDAAVRNAMDSIGKILADNGLDFGKVVKCTVMLDDMADWPRFNAVYVPYFEGKRLPARSAFGADGLALGAPLEVECIATFE
ncbi:RidA family protein [Sphingobium chungbukense]|uniref:Endoribonuclease L-PSP n=1 Tax=Sphingobium chungbukense TaxID=56193 RepID=A0A0M3ANE5_9SPHN|nr:RidA family protein [Sphingobium chungbukense]KKW91458.1 endoribonuclease L-PSP [Sphingobium chungbukense]